MHAIFGNYIGALLLVGMSAACRPAAAPEPSPVALDYYADLGGDFELTDQEGRIFRLEAHRGRPVLLFFGYTFCPDFCPTTLSRIARTYEVLEGARERLLTVFVSIDPARDTPEAIGEYLRYFSIPAVGLTGRQEEVDRVAGAYGASYALSGTGATYQVEHTTYVYLLDGRGRVRFLFDQADPPERMARVVEQLLAEAQEAVPPRAKSALLAAQVPGALGCGVRPPQRPGPLWFVGGEEGGEKGGERLQPVFPLGLDRSSRLPAFSGR